MDGYSESHRLVASALESGLPLVRAPYERISGTLNMRESELFAIFSELIARGLVRKFGAFVDFRALGLHGFLFGARTKPGELDEVVRWLGSLSCVTHNYGRSAPLDLWFTAILDGDGAVEELCAELQERNLAFVCLSAARRIKLRPSFACGPGDEEIVSAGCLEVPTLPREGVPDPLQRNILAAIQRDFPACSRPFARVAESLGLEEDALIAELRKLEAVGVLRRIGVSLNHGRAGYRRNTLIAWSVPDMAEEALVERAWKMVAPHHWASHCYLRSALRTNLPFAWPYNLYIMVHARTEDELARREGILSRSLAEYDCISMRTVREYKKKPYEIQ